MTTLNLLNSARDRGLDKLEPWAQAFPLHNPPEPSTEFPIAALGRLGCVVEELVDRRQVPVGLAAASILAGASLAVQGQYDVETLVGDTCPTSLMIITVAASGERKTVCDKFATKGAKDWEQALHKERTARKVGDDEIDSEERRIDVIQRDVTIEALFAGFQHGQPSQALLSDEAGSLLGGYSMSDDNKTKTFADLSSFWSGGVQKRSRKGTKRRPEMVRLNERRLTVHLQGQPMVMAKILEDPIANNQGLLARALIHQPLSKIGTRTETREQIQRARNTPECDAFAAKVKSLIGGRIEPDEADEIDRPVLRLSELAIDKLLEFSNSVELKSGPGHRFADYTHLTNKAAENAVRIAGILAVFDDKTEIDDVAISNGIEIVTYFLSEAIRLAESSSTDLKFTYAEKIARQIANKPGRNMKRVDLTQSASLPKSGPYKRSAKLIGQLLKILVDAGWAQNLNGTIYVNPNLPVEKE